MEIRRAWLEHVRHGRAGLNMRISVISQTAQQTWLHGVWRLSFTKTQYMYQKARNGGRTRSKQTNKRTARRTYGTSHVASGISQLSPR